MILIWLAALVVLLDQLTKNIVVAVMAEGQSIPIIPNIFHLTYILNPGAAFGMFAHNRTFFICVALLVLIIVWWFRKEILAEPLCVRAGTALFIGGAVGNLIDRAENGMVVDFFDFRIWPIFNVADYGWVMSAEEAIVQLMQGVTISGMHKGETKLTIPNQVVREQLFAYILDTYHENDLTFDSYEKRKLASGLAYDGKWKPYFEYIAGCLHRYASQRDKQKGEYFVHGFTLAMTAQNPFYRPVSEKDSQEGYVNLFLHPLLDIYKDMSHSYIIELKYAKGKDSSERIEQLRRQAIEQAERYASSESVQKAIGPTMLHKIIIVYRGMEMVVCEEL